MYNGMLKLKRLYLVLRCMNSAIVSPDFDANSFDRRVCANEKEWRGENCLATRLSV